MGLQRSRVTAVSDGSNAPKGWVKVALSGLGATTESDWVAWPALMGGDTRGFWFPPKTDTRCVIGFDDSDELNLEPLVLSAYFDETVKAPGADLAKPRIKLGNLEITFNETDVCLEIGGSTYKLARADLTKQAIQDVVTTFNAHSHTSVAGAFGAITGILTPTATAGAPGELGSDKAKVSS